MQLTGPMSDPAPKIRLKPRLITETPATPTAADAASPAPTPPANVPNEPAAASPAPRSFALRAPTVAPGTSASNLPAATTTADNAPPPPSSGPAATAPAEATKPKTTPEETKKIQRMALIIGIAGLVVFIGIAAIAFPRLTRRAREIKEARARWAEREAQQDAEPDLPTAPGNTTVATPPASATAKQGADAAISTPKQVSAPPAPTATPVTQPGSAPNADSTADPFRLWVATVKISGIRAGKAPRVLIGNAAFNEGDVVNPALDITFDSYDPNTHTLRFRDHRGTVVDRRDW